MEYGFLCNKEISFLIMLQCVMLPQLVMRATGPGMKLTVIMAVWTLFREAPGSSTSCLNGCHHGILPPQGPPPHTFRPSTEGVARGVLSPWREGSLGTSLGVSGLKGAGTFHRTLCLLASWRTGPPKILLLFGGPLVGTKNITLTCFS